MRGFQAVFLASLLFAGLAFADNAFAPPPSGSQAGVPTVKQQGTKPLTGTRATGDEDETNDLEVQRNRRTVDGGRSAFKSTPKVDNVAPETPRAGDNSYRDPGRFAPGRPTAVPQGPIVNPNPPTDSGNGNAIPVHK